MKTIKTNLWVFYLMLASATVVSCYPEKPDDLDVLDVVQTQYDTTFNFNSKQYYLLPDTIPIVSDNRSYVKTSNDLMLDSIIINKIANQMNQAGYTRITEADTSNSSLMNKALVVLPTRFTVVHSNYYYDYYYYGYDWWDWYYGLNYYYPGYAARYYYPWGYPVTYSYAVGTVIVELLDPASPSTVNNATMEVTYPVRWIAVLNGLAESSLQNTQGRITTGIEQAFKQSPYLTIK